MYMEAVLIIDIKDWIKGSPCQAWFKEIHLSFTIVLKDIEFHRGNYRKDIHLQSSYFDMFTNIVFWVV